jgi:tetratricopeptide (TPR) repeat protein
MTGIKRLVIEIHRRSLWQVMGVFLAASWGVIQVVDFLTREVGLPAWTPSMAFVFLLLGFPVVLATAIVQEGRPGRGRDDGDLEPVAGVDPNPARDLEDASREGVVERGVPDVPRASDSPSSSAVGGIHRVLTWRNAILGGVAAFALLGFSVALYFVMWSTGIGPVGNLVAQGVLDEGEFVLLADFGDPSGTGLADVVTEALRVDLQESPMISLASPAYVTAGMPRMGLPADAPFTAGVARELAVRDGLKAVIQGEVAAVGSGFLLTASVVEAQSGDVLSAFRVPVTSEHDLLRGIDRLSREIRERTGESLRSIARGAGLAQATTASLDALRVYTEAIRIWDQGRQIEAIPLLEEALAIDPEFAMAWRKLAVTLSNERLDAERMIHASQRAYELRRRLTYREAAHAEAWYVSTVQQNSEGAIEVYRRLLERHPDDGTALNNLSVRLIDLGRWEESEDFLRRAALRPDVPATTLGNLVGVLWNVGKRNEAWAWQDTISRRFPDALLPRRIHAFLLAGEERWDEARAVGEGVRRDATPGASEHVFQAVVIAGAHLARGDHAAAVQIVLDARRDAIENRAWELAYFFPGEERVNIALALEGPAATRSALADLTRVVPLDSLSERSPHRASLARWLAMAGDVEAGQRVFSDYEAAFPPAERGRGFRIDRELFGAASAWGEGDWGAAASAFDRAHRDLQPCGAHCVRMAEWGIALEEAGRVDEALEKYRWHLADTRFYFHPFRIMWTPSVLERMARIHRARGETAEARAADERIVEQFGAGNGPYEDFVSRARARLAESD